jgi:phospholipase C
MRFVAKRFGTKSQPLEDPNITAWRSAVSGDLTSAFNFTTPNSAVVTLPSTTAYIPPDDQRHDSYYPLPPLLQALPIQEPGTRPARAIPYLLNVSATASPATGRVTLDLINTGARAGVFQVRSSSLLQPPRGYTVAGRTSLSDVWDYSLLDTVPYGLSVYGPNGFFRAYQGGLAAVTSANLQTTLEYQFSQGGVSLSTMNMGKTTCNLQILDVYTSQSTAVSLAPGARHEQSFSLAKYHGWYDFVLTVDEDQTFRQQLAGHLETGEDSVSDPAIGAT